MKAERATSGSDFPRFERRVLLGTLLCVLPAALALAGVLALGRPRGAGLWALLAGVIGSSVVLLRWQYRRVVFPLYSLGSLLEALREGDYSLRGARGGTLGSIVYDVNSLAERLQDERLQFEESSYLLGKTLAALDSAVFVFDEQRRLRLINPAGQHLLAGARHRLLGLGASELGLEPLLEGPSSRVQSHDFRGRSGRFQIRVAPLRSGGRGGRLLMINDVGRVLREEERQAWQRLLRVLGHEVNNSLTPIRSMAATLAALADRDPLPHDWRQDFREGLGVIGNRAGALGRFLSGYSRLARLPPLHMRQVELGELVAKVARLEQRRAIVVEAGDPVQVQGDPDQLEQALINLVANAVEALGDDEGGVRMRWYVDGERACLEVEDDGPGPSSENLFVPFFTTKPGGSGIGLALVRQIAEAHDGEATLQAREGGRGAMARLWLPHSAVV